MKENDHFKDLHIGAIVKALAHQKGLSSKEIAKVLRRYNTNADKIYKLHDMDIEDVVHLSWLLQYNILEYLTHKYLPHLYNRRQPNETDSYRIKIDLKTQRVTIDDFGNHYDFLKDIHCRSLS
jgi:hypothetical protein